MTCVKRRRSEDSLVQDKPTDLLIVTADTITPLEAHSAVLGLFSRVVDDLPRASNGKTTWDLSKLVLEGQSSPVSSAVVRQWLDLVYSRVDAGRQPPKFPRLSEPARSLLLFADAVGTSRVVMDGFMDALVAQPGLALCVVVNGGGEGGEGGGGGGAGAGAAPLPPPLQLQLALRGKLYFCTTSGGLNALDVPTSGTKHTVVSGGPLAPHRAALPGAVAAALEGWLFLAGRLGLVALVRLLLDFYKAQLVLCTVSLLYGAVAQVFSRRVLECMPHELLVEGFVSSCLNDTHTVQAEVDSGSKLIITLTAPEAASVLGHKPSKVESETVTTSNLLCVGMANAYMRLSVGGLGVAEQRRVLKEVLQRLEEEEQAEAPA